MDQPVACSIQRLTARAASTTWMLPASIFTRLSWVGLPPDGGCPCTPLSRKRPQPVHVIFQNLPPKATAVRCRADRPCLDNDRYPYKLSCLSQTEARAAGPDRTARAQLPALRCRARQELPGESA